MASIGERFSKAGAGYEWLRYYFALTPGALFTLGLIVSSNFVEYACVSLLMDFYANKLYEQKRLAKVAMLLSFQEGLVSLFSVIYARLIDSHVPRRFYAILLSTASYIMGLVLLWSFSQGEPQALNLLIFFFAAFLIASGKGGREPLLEPFLADQLGENDGSNQREDDQKRIEVCKNIWLRIAWIVGVITAVFGLLEANWLKVFKISTIFMGVTGFLFLFGCNKESNPYIQVALDSNSEPHRLIQGKYLRFLLISSCTAYGMVLATGNTFFQEQGNKMKALKLNGKDSTTVRFSIFLVIKTFVRDITALVFWLSGSKKQRTTLVRIGSGMICAIICSIVAWKIEIGRREETSVILLCPQYVLLGLVEGLSQGGLEKLLENHQVKPFKNAGRVFKDLISCSGNFLSIPVISIVSSWFKNFDQDKSHLDRYYLMLGVLNSVFLCIYACVACLYAKHVKLSSAEVELVGSTIKVDEPVQC